MQRVLSVTVMLVDLSVAIMQTTVSVAIMQLEVFAALMQVTVSSKNLIFLSLLTPTYHQIDQKTFKSVIIDLHFANFLNILPRLRYLEERNYIYRSIERVIQYFCFLDTPFLERGES